MGDQQSDVFGFSVTLHPDTHYGDPGQPGGTGEPKTYGEGWKEMLSCVYLCVVEEIGYCTSLYM